jgi:hypothetical protein
MDMPTSETGAQREKLNRAPYDLVPIELIEACAEGLNYGKTKYPANNWRKGIGVVQVCCSLIRHVFAYMAGEDIDKASGQPHINLMACNVAFLATYSRSGPMIDDRHHWTPPT